MLKHTLRINDVLHSFSPNLISCINPCRSKLNIIKKKKNTSTAAELGKIASQRILSNLCSILTNSDHIQTHRWPIINDQMAIWLTKLPIFAQQVLDHTSSYPTERKEVTTVLSKPPRRLLSTGRTGPFV